MLPIAPANIWSRVSLRVHLRVREGMAPTATFAEGTRSLGGGIGAAVERPFPHSGSGVATIGSLGLLVALAVILYAHVLVSMVQQWWSDPNYGHGFLVPAFAAYILLRAWNRVREVPVKGSNWGLPYMLFALGLLVLGTLASEHFTARVSMLFLLAGVIVFLAGWQMLRAVAFPVGYLIFMIPLPALVYYQLTFPLQLLASRLGAHGLVAIGVPTIREGNLLILPNCTLEVVEACSGVRSLISLLAAVVGYVYLCEPRLWKQIVLVAAAVPMVIVSNGGRLVAVGVLSYLYGPSVDSGAVHTALGLVCFALAFLAILLLHRLLGRDPGPRTPASAQS